MFIKFVCVCTLVHGPGFKWHDFLSVSVSVAFHSFQLQDWDAKMRGVEYERGMGYDGIIPHQFTKIEYLIDRLLISHNFSLLLSITWSMPSEKQPRVFRGSCWGLSCPPLGGWSRLRLRKQPGISWLVTALWWSAVEGFIHEYPLVN